VDTVAALTSWGESQIYAAVGLQKQLNDVMSETMKPVLWEGRQEMSIGGDNCHLCGAEKKCSSGFTEYGKKCGFRGYIMYTCGTAVYARRKGCNDRPKRVSVGDKCIKVSK
jgi:hypothetical protein